MTYLISGSGWELMIVVLILFGIIIPIALFIIGLMKYTKNKNQGKIILIIATVYSVISFGICGGLGF